MDSTQKNTPEKKFRAGPVTATIWKNTGKRQDGEIAEFKTISLERSYKDKAGNWQNTSSFRVADLPRASVVLQKAYEYIVLKEPMDSAGSELE